MNTWQFATNNYQNEDSILEYINKRTHQNVIMQKSLLGSLVRMVVGFAILGSILYAVIKFRWVIAHPISWLVVAFLVFFICCGGTVHNILHHAPLTGATRSKTTGQIEYEYISTGVLFYV